MIVGFLIVHVVLALLVPKTLWAMVAGGPRSHGAAQAGRGRPRDMRSLFRPDPFRMPPSSTIIGR